MLKTLILDGTNPLAKAKTSALELKDEEGQSETIHTAMNDEGGSKGVKEDSFSEEAGEMFYKNNYPEDSQISSVHTAEHIEHVIGQRKDLTSWMRETLHLHQRSFNENEVVGNFKRD